MKLDRKELFPVLDENGNVTGSATRAECHSGSMILHPVVHLHVFSLDRSALYLQRRSMLKDIQPGKWDTAVGGHVDYGETVEVALCREAREELGIEVEAPTPLLTYIFQSAIEREQVNSFAIFVNPATTHFTPAPDEVDEGRFWTLDDIEASIGTGIFTPNFEQEYRRILPIINKL